jgi:hypothetical protein
MRRLSWYQSAVNLALSGVIGSAVVVDDSPSSSALEFGEDGKVSPPFHPGVVLDERTKT